MEKYKAEKRQAHELHSSAYLMGISFAFTNRIQIMN